MINQLTGDKKYMGDRNYLNNTIVQVIISPVVIAPSVGLVSKMVNGPRYKSSGEYSKYEKPAEAVESK